MLFVHTYIYICNARNKETPEEESIIIVYIFIIYIRYYSSSWHLCLHLERIAYVEYESSDHHSNSSFEWATVPGCIISDFCSNPDRVHGSHWWWMMTLVNGSLARSVNLNTWAGTRAWVSSMRLTWDHWLIELSMRHEFGLPFYYLLNRSLDGGAMKKKV